MAQVPCYLIVGNGSVAHHFKHYFSLLSLPYLTWHRKEPQSMLHAHLKQATHILLLIKDDALCDFAALHLTHLQKRPLLIHFSGSVVSDQIIGAHPLMCFGQTLYSFQHYQTIPFVIDHDAPDFADVLPGLPNPAMRLEKSKKAKYHALCVMSGNFSCLLWQKFFSSLEKEFNIPFTFGKAYLAQQTQNLLTAYQSALTGPLVREDVHTIESNLAALSDDPFKEVYQSFISCYQQMKENNA